MAANVTISPSESIRRANCHPERTREGSSFRRMSKILRGVPLRMTVVALSVLMCDTALVRAGEFKDLGVQISSSTIIGTTFGKDGAGRDVVYTVMRGHPAKLLSFELETGALLQSLPLDGATGAWNACTASDGSIYVGTDANAHLYRYVPGEKEAHDLGLVAPGQNFVWDVTSGKDGEV